MVSNFHILRDFTTTKPIFFNVKLLSNPYRKPLQSQIIIIKPGTAVYKGTFKFQVHCKPLRDIKQNDACFCHQFTKCNKFDVFHRTMPKAGSTLKQE